MRRAQSLAGILGLLLTAAAIGKGPGPADVIYLGTVITMDDDRPTVEAVAIRGDTIVAVGTRAEGLRLRTRKTRLVELGERALLPGFIDAHGHLTATAGLARYANLAPPPAGPIGSIAQLQQALRQQIAAQAIPPGQWVVGFGYDDSLLAEKRHPVRAELDSVSTEHPVFVVHVSGHLSVANTALLELTGIDATTPDPAGGVIRRQVGSREPDGVLEESAHSAMYTKIPPASEAESLPLISKALHLYASEGLTTVQDGGALPANLALLSAAAKGGLLNLDVVAYRYWTPIGAAFPDELGYGQYRNRLKIGGIKLVLDGSPQGKTAYLSAPYRVAPAGQPADYRGYPTLPPPAVAKAALDAMSRRVPVLAHANGDAAAEILIDAVAAARLATGNVDDQVVMIHAQTVRDDQLDRMRDLSIVPSFFIGHAFYWGDWHREQTLGFPRAERISPARSAIERSLPFTLHNDTPVVPPNMRRTLWSAVTRRTRSNDILGPQQRLTVMEALAGITINAARQYGEQEKKGSIRVGKLADLVILSQDPRILDPENLQDLEVVETISHGKSVYLRP